MKKLFFILFFLTTTTVSANDLSDFNTVMEENSSHPSVLTQKLSPSLEKSQGIKSSALNKSEKGFCSISEAAEKLIRISNSQTMGFSDYGLLEIYEENLKKDCAPRKYIPTQIKAPDTPNLVCYELGGKCREKTFEIPQSQRCTIETNKSTLSSIYSRMINKRDEIIAKEMKDLRKRAQSIAEGIVNEKITKKLAEKPLEQIRLSWADMYKMRGTLAYMLGFKLDAAIDAVGQGIFSNIEYFSPIIALSGPAGFVVLSGFPIVEEAFQCNISIKNMILKGTLAAGTKLVFKVPIIKSETLSGIAADSFIKYATTTEASKWVKHFFGDGLEVESVSVTKEYGKEFALITVKTVLRTAQNYGK
ncbi:MAG: hypothetical protein K6357_03860 [Elusimicrobiota bacterium]